MFSDRMLYGSLLAKEAYEAKVGAEALARAGANMQLKGHVHEILYRDAFNFNPANFLSGNEARLVASPTARMKDIVIMDNANRVAGHMQLKDTISPAGLAKTARQINSGYYGKTSVFGTEETVAGLAGKVRRNVHSTGISSETTSRIAGKALGQMPTLSAVGAAARSGGAWGAAIGAGFEAVSSLGDVLNGDKDVGEAAADIAWAGTKGAVVGAASSAASSVAAGAAGSALTALGVTGGALACAPLAVGLGAACLVGGLISSIFEDD